MSEPRMQHQMIAGSHEWPRQPECVCGAPWSWWDEKCLGQHMAARLAEESEL